MDKDETKEAIKKQFDTNASSEIAKLMAQLEIADYQADKINDKLYLIYQAINNQTELIRKLNIPPYLFSVPESVSEEQLDAFRKQVMEKIGGENLFARGDIKVIPVKQSETIVSDKDKLAPSSKITGTDVQKGI